MKVASYKLIAICTYIRVTTNFDIDSWRQLQIGLASCCTVHAPHMKFKFSL